MKHSFKVILIMALFFFFSLFPALAQAGQPHTQPSTACVLCTDKTWHDHFNPGSLEWFARFNFCDCSGTILMDAGAGSRADNVEYFRIETSDSERYFLKVLPRPEDGGRVDYDPPPDHEGKYRLGAKVTLTAVPAAGFFFSQWSITGVILPAIIPHPNPVSVVMDQNRKGHAAFVDTRPEKGITLPGVMMLLEE